MQKLILTAAFAVTLAACGQPETEADSGTGDSAGADAGSGAAGSSAAADASTAGSAEFASDEERTLYALGAVVADSLTDFDLADGELEIVLAGMRDAHSEAPLQVDLDEYGPQIQVLAAERSQARAAEEKVAAEAFADDVAAEPDAERTASGLIYVPVAVGEGASPEATDTVRVHYHGTLRDGTVFDSSVERGEPVEFPLNGVIPCWTEGVPMMQVGGKARFLCPSDIAYGDQGTGPIPGGAALLFEIELLEIIEEAADEGAD